MERQRTVPVEELPVYDGRGGLKFVWVSDIVRALRKAEQTVMAVVKDKLAPGGITASPKVWSPDGSELIEDGTLPVKAGGTYIPRVMAAEIAIQFAEGIIIEESNPALDE